MTRVTNKHLLPVYNKPMIMFPLELLSRLGIIEIMIVAGKGYAGHFLELLGSGSKYGVSLRYTVQEEPGGIAQALSLVKDFIGKDHVAVCLGDNIFEHDPDIRDFNGGGRVYLKKVPDPQRFGVALTEQEKVISIIEKPENPVSDLAVTGFYLYDQTVFTKIDSVHPSARGELEITDVNNLYIKEGKLEARYIDGEWTDAGTVESLYRASSLVRDKFQRSAE
jgi:glucose-1-phosphate thymidylyltransferase